MIDVSFRGEAAPSHRSCDVCLEDLMMVETQPELCDCGELRMIVMIFKMGYLLLEISSSSLSISLVLFLHL